MEIGILIVLRYNGDFLFLLNLTETIKAIEKNTTIKLHSKLIVQKSAQSLSMTLWSSSSLLNGA
jgi:hypothetical protein